MASLSEVHREMSQSLNDILPAEKHGATDFDIGKVPVAHPLLDAAGRLLQPLRQIAVL
jgi:hypothetical protein